MMNNLPEPMRTQMDEMYRSYRRLVYSYIRDRLSCDEEQASDLTEEVFERACRSLKGKTEAITYPKKWLMKIAENVCSKYGQRGSKCEIPYTEIFANTPDGEISPLELLPGDEEEQPERLAEQRELRQMLLNDLAEMPELIRKAIVLRYAEGWSVRAIAKYLQQTPTTVTRGIRKGVEHLRGRYQSLEEY